MERSSRSKMKETGDVPDDTDEERRRYVVVLCTYGWGD